ncbi:MAG: helix-turn-helix transcriptional regulator [Rhodobacteraceae bacterium]|nr:helix-turn-helix transcriptional regulator [Paracoccaceae bacterium]
MFQRMAIAALGALAHETRMAIFARLAQVGLEGVPAGVLAKELGLPGPTLSFHLKELDRAGLVAARRLGRKIIYTANISAMRAVIDFLAKDCAGLPVSAGR